MYTTFFAEHHKVVTSLVRPTGIEVLDLVNVHYRIPVLDQASGHRSSLKRKEKGEEKKKVMQLSVANLSAHYPHK